SAGRIARLQHHRSNAAIDAREDGVLNCEIGLTTCAGFDEIERSARRSVRLWLAKQCPLESPKLQQAFGRETSSPESTASTRSSEPAEWVWWSRRITCTSTKKSRSSSCFPMRSAIRRPWLVSPAKLAPPPRSK